MLSKGQIILAFDAYGTLLSTESIATRLASHFGPEKAANIAQEWRKYQLEYTWRLNSMNKYEPFSSVTQKSLQHALAESRVTLSSQEITSLMNAYNTLSLFPDVPPLFSHLKSNPHFHAVVFSNGTKAMISASLTQSPDLSPHAHVFEDVVVVEPVQRFKPCPEVYRYLCRKVGKEGKETDVWLISGNPFDVTGANAVGMRTCWVDRSGLGWVDELVDGEMGRPTMKVRGLDEVVSAVEAYVSKE
ncbi:haloacid dehalogenase [Lindgomyces ingoldianus]|uniref:Haloacid dehalogenase n=1 Tax=Lindgomyces ingoldianus TaxID=673940 RepID=A0ACB6QTE8_9PLEO|nr:haloacid dehalogenase [Lindgomyces ingoldianus]KAF2470299.1 haloacid dehalogenase [Lindgomyces ingoldianus]